ncbi:MAG: hypothetical protein FWD18_00145 [Micrococcales bacterium]|nr:hypothetical protein [Micrococcales bacterium]
MNDSPAASSTVVAVNLAGSDVGAGWGKARTVAVAEVSDGVVTRWTEHEVGWDALHDEGHKGAHHARIVRFCREHGVQVVVTGHLGAPMHRTLIKLGCKVVTGLTGDARDAAVTAVDAPASEPVVGATSPGPVAVTIQPLR